jgi:hypothetical protein
VKAYVRHTCGITEKVAMRIAIGSNVSKLVSGAYFCKYFYRLTEIEARGDSK